MPLFLTLALLSASQVLFEAQSRYSHIRVRDDQGKRDLMFDDITQSSAKPGAPKQLLLDYTQVSMIGLCFAKPNRTLVIGLGGASMPNFLHAQYPDARIDAVEIDPAVVDVAQRFFDFTPGPRVRVFTEDGAAFVARTKDRYDLMFLDAYAPDFIPKPLSTPEFFAQAAKVLADDGVLVSNVWGPPSPGYQEMIDAQRSAFAELYVVKARRSGNHIFIATKQARAMARGDLAACGDKLVRDRSFGYDLKQTVEEGYEKQK